MSYSLFLVVDYIKRTSIIKSRLYIKVIHYVIFLNRLNTMTAPWSLRAGIECKLIPLRHIACEIHPPLSVSISKAFHKHSSKYSAAHSHIIEPLNAPFWLTTAEQTQFWSLARCLPTPVGCQVLYCICFRNIYNRLTYVFEHYFAI